MEFYSSDPNTLEHYGVKGMKWGVRKNRVKTRTISALDRKVMDAYSSDSLTKSNVGHLRRIRNKESEDYQHFLKDMSKEDASNFIREHINRVYKSGHINAKDAKKRLKSMNEYINSHDLDDVLRGEYQGLLFESYCRKIYGDEKMNERRANARKYSDSLSKRGEELAYAFLNDKMHKKVNSISGRTYGEAFITRYRSMVLRDIYSKH